jgi:hypothetical protein
VLLIIVLTLLLFIYIFWKALKKLLLNSLVGIILILVLNLVFQMDIDLNLYIISAAALFGLPGVGTILILHLGGMI